MAESLHFHVAKLQSEVFKQSVAFSAGIWDISVREARHWRKKNIIFGKG